MVKCTGRDGSVSEAKFVVNSIPNINYMCQPNLSSARSDVMWRSKSSNVKRAAIQLTLAQPASASTSYVTILFLFPDFRAFSFQFLLAHHNNPALLFYHHNSPFLLRILHVCFSFFLSVSSSTQQLSLYLISNVVKILKLLCEKLH